MRIKVIECCSFGVRLGVAVFSVLAANLDHKVGRLIRGKGRVADKKFNEERLS